MYNQENEEDSENEDWCKTTKSVANSDTSSRFSKQMPSIDWSKLQRRLKFSVNENTMCICLWQVYFIVRREPVVPKRFLLLSEFFFYPLLDRARFRGRCWAAIRLSHRPEPSGRAVHGEVDGLDIGGRHGRRFVLLRHTHKPQRRPYPFCTSMER